MRNKVFKAEQFEADSIGSGLYLGTIVKIVDGSWIVGRRGNRYCSDFYLASSYSGCKDHLYQIIYLNKPFPTPKSDTQSAIPINNIKIRSLNTGKIYFCHNGNLSAITHGNHNGDGKSTVRFAGSDIYRTPSEVFAGNKYINLETADYLCGEKH